MEKMLGTLISDAIKERDRLRADAFAQMTVKMPEDVISYFKECFDLGAVDPEYNKVTIPIMCQIVHGYTTTISAAVFLNIVTRTARENLQSFWDDFAIDPEFYPDPEAEAMAMVARRVISSNPHLFTRRPEFDGFH